VILATEVTSQVNPGVGQDGISRAQTAVVSAPCEWGISVLTKVLVESRDIPKTVRHC
jgi:hypothetical protein